MRMRPIDKAQDHLGKSFEEIFLYYLDNGYMYSSDDLFLLADERKSKKELDFCDIWYIKYACGNLRRIFEICPHQNEYVEFERMDERTRRYRFSTLKEKINGIKTTRST